ncbi:MAG: biosynthetic-type acetolactate synthase large subunit [Bacteroidaceae bacterium]|nr:biosynthetic-type acetolactate synthase large subunit [Bacteroidaceae bacterium]
MAISGFSEKAPAAAKENLPHISGSDAVIRSLIAEGVETIFGYPGGAITPVYDSLYDYRDKINHVLVRHEQCAVHAAQGYARATGRTGVCVVTSGPGATNTVTGLADAMLDSTPVVLISGQVNSSILGTDAFQEINFIEITNSVTKWNCQVKRAEDIPEAIARAFYVASSGRPGPVVVDITKDAQNGMLDFEYNQKKFIRSYMPYNDIDNDSILEAARLINFARKPMVLIGQGVILGNAEQELREFVEKSGIPAASTLMGLSVLPTGHPLNMGMIGMHGNYGPNIKNKDCDLIIAIGMRFDERAVGVPANFGINAKIIHMEIDPAEVNKLVYADVAVMGDVKQTLPLLTDKIAKNDHSAWIDEFRLCANIEREDVIEPALIHKGPMLRMGEVVNAVSNVFKDAILVTDVGQQQMFAARYFRFSRPRSIITSGGLGTMGFGLPAAIGAKLGAPEREVCLFVGDGGIQMTSQELATMYQSNAGVKIILLNNEYLGMVRQWQELFYDHRYSSTELINPEFDLLAKANRIPYRCVAKQEELEDAIREMHETEGAFMLEVKVLKEENVFPMVPAGEPLENIRLE